MEETFQIPLYALYLGQMKTNMCIVNQTIIPFSAGDAINVMMKVEKIGNDLELRQLKLLVIH